MKKVLTLTVLGLFLVAGNAMALTLGDNGNEDTLQEVFGDVISGGIIDAEADQSDVELWQPAEGSIDSYLITMLQGDSGVLGIYSKSTGAEYNLVLGDDKEIGFSINDSGALWIGGSEVDSNFGDTFGFYWENTTNALMSYTEDAKNIAGTGYGDSNTLGLSYLVDDGLSVLTEATGGKTVLAQGNNDWILAFEDRASVDIYGNEGDGDFNDAVFYIEDMNPVPEPGTVLLLGAGLLGLIGLGRKRIKK